MLCKIDTWNRPNNLASELCKRQIAEVGSDTGNEAQHTDEQEDDADDGGGLTNYS
jgi:hypothetical protein